MSDDRKIWLSLLAKAPAGALDAKWRALGLSPGFAWLRAPEIGAVMARGRVGATGAPFNVGEITVTRCALRLDTGEVGHGYVQGRDKTKAEQAALVDALMQTEAADEVRAAVLAPLQVEMAQAAGETAAKAAATKVDFFTMVRGENS